MQEGTCKTHISFFIQKILRGRPNTMVRHYILDDIRKIIPSIDKYDSFKTWAHIANNELLWAILVKYLGRNDPQPRNYSPKWDG